MSPPPQRELPDEVTRVSAVEYLQGTTGHAVGSLSSLLLGGAAYLVTGEPVFGFGGLVCGFLLTANGLSIRLWDVVQASVRSRTRDATGTDGDPGRTLSPPSMSREHKAELTAGLVQIAALVAGVSVVLWLVQRLGVERGLFLLGGVLAVSNLGVLAVGRLRR